MRHSAGTAKIDTMPGPQSSWDRIPAALRVRAQWAVAGVDKRPLTIDGRAASSTDESTWTDFETACGIAAERGWHIGYMLQASDPYSCIDLDVKDTTPQEQIKRFEK